MKRIANLLLSCVCCCLLALTLGGATNRTDSGPSVALTRQAVALHMEPAALGELWRTKQPVIISKPNAEGQLVTTTYKLSDDGQSIITSSVNEDQQAPQPEATTPAAVLPTRPQVEWEYVPSAGGNRPTYTIGGPSPFGGNWPDFGTPVAQWPSLPRNNDWPSFQPPAGVTPQTSTKTELDDQGRKVTTTIRTYSVPGPQLTATWPSFALPSGNTPKIGANWPSFELPTGITPQTSTKTEKEDQGRTVTTTTSTYRGPGLAANWPSFELPKGITANWPSFQLPAGITPQTSTKTEKDDKGCTTTTTTSTYSGPVQTNWTLVTGTPALPAFSHSLPGWFNRPPLGGGAMLPASPPLPTPVPDMRTTTPLPDLEDFLKQTTPSTVGNVHFEDQNPNEPPTHTVNRVTSYSSNYSGPTPPKSADLEPAVRDMLNRAGITDEDIAKAQAQDGIITRTRVTPDGHVLKTTVRVSSVPVASEPTVYQPQAQPVAAVPLQPQDKSIDNFLSRVNLSPADILAKNGEVVKTIVDNDGRVLSATFVLSNVKGNEQGQGQGQDERPKK